VDVPSLTGQPELLRLINRILTSSQLKDGRVLSRSDLAKHTGLSRATIAILAAELLEAGLVEEVGLGASTGGRPPMLLRFNPNAAVAIGAVLQDHRWTIVVTDLQARVLLEEDAPIAGSSPQEAVAALKRGIDAVTRSVNALGHRCLPAIGLGTPGLVDVASGVIKSAVDVGWFEVPFQSMVEEALGRKTYIANRSKLGALAEYWYGAHRGISDLIYLSIGTGVSAGIVHQGKLFLGSNSSAGEVGHLTIVPDGPLCPCGNHGCLQEYVSHAAIVRRAKERAQRHGDPMSPLSTSGEHNLATEVIFEAAESGDTAAVEVVRETARYLGIAVANLINLFNPELIVLGGPIGNAGRILLEPLRAEVAKRAMAYPASNVEISIGVVGQNAGAVGAAVLTLERAMELLFPRTLDQPKAATSLPVTV
jgi:glucokinase-like ROK family protein